jgi:endoglucanase
MKTRYAGPHIMMRPYLIVALLASACGGGSDAPSPNINTQATAVAGVSVEKSAEQSASTTKTGATTQKISNGAYKLRNACNSKLVDVQSAPAPWSRVEQRSDGARAGQGWDVKDLGDGTYSLIVPGTSSALQTSYGKTVQETPLDVWSYSGNAAQRWQLVDVGNGNIKLALAAAPSQVLDVKANSAAENADIWLYADNGTCAQQFKLEPTGSAPPPTGNADAAAVAKALGRGANLQGLEAPREGDWGPLLNDDFFNRMQEAGFNTVRIPARWSNHALAAAPYTIDEAFFKRVDYAINATTSRGMRAVINMHHYRQLDGDTFDNNEFAVNGAILEERFVAIWKQIAARYANQADTVLFELYNEPHGNTTAQKWNSLLARTLSEVRKTNPNRYVVVGPVGYNSVNELKNLVLPADQRLIVTVHNYDPFQFTHQGASWAQGSNAWLGTKCCSQAQKDEINRAMDTAKAWSTQSGRPVWVGEFGSYEMADLASRVQYTRIARDSIEQRGFTWAYWEFYGGFGIYDPNNKQWRTELRDALLK